MTETPDFGTARLEGIALVAAFLDGVAPIEHRVERVRELIAGSDHAPHELLIALSGVTAAMVEQVAPVLGVTPADYLDSLRQWVLADAATEGEA